LALGHALGAGARPGDVVLLEGPIGAGKTVLVHGIAAGLGAGNDVASPTFVLVRQYSGRLPLVHADLYRLASRPEIEALALLELAEPGLLVVEWADRAPWLAAPGCLRLGLEPGAAGQERVIRVLDGGAPHLVQAMATASVGR
jgi:tRNA threonylcarbamoyladenosine biosynthesis protein TsaE